MEATINEVINNSIFEPLAAGMHESAITSRRCEARIRKVALGVLSKVDGCADVMPWPEQNSFDIQACADESSAKFLTAEEAAAYLGGLNSRTLTRWAREGYLPAIPLGEGKRRLWRFLRTDLESWMLARRRGGQNAA
jgi:excisionase family DNA binding protein